MRAPTLFAVRNPQDLRPSGTFKGWRSTPTSLSEGKELKTRKAKMSAEMKERPKLDPCRGKKQKKSYGRRRSANSRAKKSTVTTEGGVRSAELDSPRERRTSGKGNARDFGKSPLDRSSREAFQGEKRKPFKWKRNKIARPPRNSRGRLPRRSKGGRTMEMVLPGEAGRKKNLGFRKKKEILLGGRSTFLQHGAEEFENSTKPLVW